MVPGTLIRKYKLNAFNPDELVAKSEDIFRDDLQRYEKLHDRRGTEEAKLCAFLHSSFSKEAKMVLRDNPEFKAAALQNDSYDMYQIAKATFSCSSSFAVASHQLIQFFQMQQTGSFSAYKDAILQHRTTIQSLFDPRATGNISIDDMCTIVFLNGLSTSSFEYPINRIHTETDAGEVPNFKDVVAVMTKYDLHKRSVTDATSTPVPVPLPPGPAILTATQSLPLCTDCNKPFPLVLSKISGKPFSLCYNCNKKRNLSTSSTLPPSVVPPSAQQIKQAQANITKAQATLLAAHSYNLPSTPAPTTPTADQLHADYMNNYMQSPAFLNYQSLSATTSASATDLWHLDSGASLVSSFDPRDIINPTLLSTPIAISGANGTIFHATHVGTSYFSSDLPIYLIPASSVKLISIGVLTEFGFRLHTNNNKSMTIIDSANHVVCTCPLEPNKVWLFPSILMTPLVTLRQKDILGNAYLVPSNPAISILNSTRSCTVPISTTSDPISSTLATTYSTKGLVNSRPLFNSTRLTLASANSFNLTRSILVSANSFNSTRSILTLANSFNSIRSILVSANSFNSIRSILVSANSFNSTHPTLASTNSFNSTRSILVSANSFNSIRSILVSANSFNSTRSIPLSTHSFTFTTAILHNSIQHNDCLKHNYNLIDNSATDSHSTYNSIRPNFNSSNFFALTTSIDLVTDCDHLDIVLPFLRYRNTVPDFNIFNRTIHHVFPSSRVLMHLLVAAGIMLIFAGVILTR